MTIVNFLSKHNYAMKCYLYFYFQSDKFTECWRWATHTSWAENNSSTNKQIDRKYINNNCIITGQYTIYRYRHRVILWTYIVLIVHCYTVVVLTTLMTMLKNTIIMTTTIKMLRQQGYQQTTPNRTIIVLTYKCTILSIDWYILN